MRNPLRPKNIQLRFWPFLVAVAAALVFFQPTPFGFGSGVVLVACGASLRTWGAGHLVKNEQLTLTGPYARLRHPMYAGSLLVGSGFATLAGGWFAPFALAVWLAWFFGSYLPRKERHESERLAARYGAPYVAYRQSVPALLPVLRAWRPASSTQHRSQRWSSARYDDNNELGTLLGLVGGLAIFTLRAFALE